VCGGEKSGGWGRETMREKVMEIETEAKRQRESKTQRKRDRKRARARTRERERTRAGVRACICGGEIETEGETVAGKGTTVA